MIASKSLEAHIALANSADTDNAINLYNTDFIVELPRGRNTIQMRYGVIFQYLPLRITMS